MDNIQMIQQEAKAYGVELSWRDANSIAILSKAFWEGGAQSSSTFLLAGRFAAQGQIVITNISQVFGPYRGNSRFTSGDNDDISGDL